MIFFNLVFIYLINSSLASSYQNTNSSLCYNCIDKVDNIQRNNASLKEFIVEIDNLCDDYNITYCDNMMEKDYKFLMSNSTKVCEKMGFCEELTLNNYIISYNMDNKYKYLYYYYNYIISYNIDISPFGDLLFSRNWILKLDEKYKSFIPLSDRGFMDCGECVETGILLLKFTTENYIYYVNNTNGLIINKLFVKNNYLPTMPLTTNYNYNKSNPNQLLNIYDSIYNGSLYMAKFDIETVPSMCISPSIGNSSCLYNNIASINLEPLKLDIPPMPISCHQELEIKCPFRNEKSKCLDCLIKFKEILANCSVNEEEVWCNNL